MTFWQAVAVAAIGVLGAVGTVWVSTRDLRLRRRMETMDRFLAIAATSQARGRENIGISEQVAAVHLLGELGVSERELTDAAYAAVTETIRWTADEGGGDVAHIRVNKHAQLVRARIEASRRFRTLNPRRTEL